MDIKCPELLFNDDDILIYNLTTIIQPGYCFGENSLLLGNVRHSITLCKSECKLDYLDIDNFKELLVPVLFNELYEKIEFL